MSRLLVIVVILILLQVVLSYLFKIATVTDDQMKPFMESEQKVLFIKYPLFNRVLQRGEVALYTSANSNDWQIGRIIGMPGESVRVENGQVFINNGQIWQLNEIYLPGNVITNATDKERWFDLTSYQYLVLGDNRGYQISLSGNVVNKENLIGVLVTRF